MNEKILSFILAFFVASFIVSIIIILKRINKKPMSTQSFRSVLDFTPDETNKIETSYFYDAINKEEKKGDPLEFHFQTLEPTHNYNEVFDELLTFGLFKNINPQYKIYEAIKDNNKTE